ncbi:MAG: HAD family hydrolase [Rubrivivax sp.]|nr:HAD family hydrolase [Rubrivivax sp.]
MRRALFLDRDGVINVDQAYVYRREDFEFMPGVFDLVRAARATAHAVVVVTNQAGIGRGMYTEDEFQSLTAWMCSAFAEQGAAIDRVYHCPTHPTAGIGAYRVDSPMRKPGPGMLLLARDELGLDLAASTLLGDKLSDVQAGLAAGVGRNLLLGTPVAVPAGVRVVPDLASAQRWLESTGATR